MENENKIGQGFSTTQPETSNANNFAGTTNTNLDKEKLACTYDVMQHEDYNQYRYCCSECQIDFICFYCIKTCHGKCKDENILVTKVNDQKKEFKCACGKNKKHKTEKSNSNNKIKDKCTLNKFDKKIKMEPINKNLCSICLFLCHNSYPEQSDAQLEKETEQKSDDCQCKEYYHSDSNLFFLKKIESKFPSLANDYNQFKESFPNFEFPLQFINCVANSETLQDIKSTVKLYFKNYLNDQNSKDKDHKNTQVSVKKPEDPQTTESGRLIPNENNLNTNNDIENRNKNEIKDSDEKKFKKIIKMMNINPENNFYPFYFSEELSKIFSYKDIYHYLSQDKSQENFLKFEIYSILYYLHVKSDFKNIKKLSTSDFMTDSIPERLSYRKFIFDHNNVMLNDIRKIYLTEENLKNIQLDETKKLTSLKNLILTSILSFSNSDFKLFEKNSDKENLDYLKPFTKLIIFSLKLMIYDIDELMSLIEKLEKFYEKCITKIKWNEDLNSLYIQGLFAKVFLLIGVSYNDLVVESYLDKEKEKGKEIKIKGFINIKDKETWTEKLMNIIMKNYKILKVRIENQKTVPTEKYRNIETKKTVTNEFNEKSGIENQKTVLYEINEKSGIEIEEINNLLNYGNKKLTREAIMEKMENLEIILNENLKLFCVAENVYKKQIDNLKMEDLEIYDKSKNLSESSKEFIELNKQIDDKFKNYFTFQNENKETNINIKKQIINLLEKNSTDLFKKENLSKIDGKENIKNLNDLLKLKVYSLEKDKDKDQINKEFIISFVEGLINSSIDETLISSLNFYKGKNKDPFYEEEEVGIILNFLSLFFLTRKGVKHFCLGNNLCIIFKLFKYFPLKILKFFSFLFKRVKTFKIDLKGHKVINIIRKEILEHNETLKISTNFETNSSILILIRSLKIITIISKFFENKYNEQIIFSFIQKINDNLTNGFFNFEKFKEIFEQEENSSQNIGINRNGEFLKNRKLDEIHDNALTESKNDENLNLSISKKLYKFYFAFFNLISKNTFYVYWNEEESKVLYECILIFIENPIDKFILAKSKLLSLRKRKILLRTIKTFYFIDRIDKFQFSKNYKYLTNKENTILYEKDNNTNSKEQLEELELKKETFYTIIEYIQMFTKEINNAKLNTDNRHHQKSYLRELIFSIKYCCDFSILSQDLYDNISNDLKNLLKVLFENFNFFKQTFSLGKDIKEFEGKDLLEKETKIFKKEELYKMFIELFEEICSEDIIKKRDLHHKIFFKKIDKSNELDYMSECLIETNLFKPLYKDETESSEENMKLLNLKSAYEKQIRNYKNSTFCYMKKQSKSESENLFSKELINYFIAYFEKLDLSMSDDCFYLITVVNRLLYYETDSTQEELKEKLKEELKEELSKKNSKFWVNFIKSYQQALQKTICYSKNYPYYCIDEFFKMVIICKEFINFLQLLSEHSNEKFHYIIFDTKIPHLEGKSIFETLVEDLIYIYNLINNKVDANFDLPHDKLLVLLNSYIDFLIEYIQTCKNAANFNLINNSIKKIKPCFDKSFEYKLPILNDVNSYRNNIICYSNIKLTELIIELFESKERNLFSKVFIYKVDVIFKQIVEHFEKEKENNKDEKNQKEKEFIKEFTRRYKNEDEFRKSLNLKLSFKLFILMKQMHNDPKIIETYKQTLENHKSDHNSKFLKVFNLLETIVVKIEIKSDKDEEKCYFFIRSWITYYLRKKTKKLFLDTVNRESTYSKLDSLIDISDYFIFEMICQANIQNKKGKETSINNVYDLNKIFFQNSAFQWVEVFNFLIVVIHQIMLMVHYYQNPGDTDVTKDISVKEGKVSELFWDNIGLGIFQCLYLIFFIVIWFVYEFPLIYQKNLMTILKRLIIFKNVDKKKDIPYETIKKFLVEKNTGLMKITNQINQEIKEKEKKSQKLSKFLAFLYSTFLNSEINVLIFSLILVFLYLVIRSPIILVLLTLIIVNLFSTLNDIVQAVYLRGKQLVTVLGFTYLIIYIFAWISLLWITSAYTVESKDLYPEVK